jgi:hypothetical protein
MIKHHSLPNPWWQVGLAVLPGLGFLLALPPVLMAGILIGLSLSSLWLAFKHRKNFEVPVWGLIPLGWFAFLIFASFPYSPEYYVTSILLALISLPLAKYNGMNVGLLPLIGGSIAANWAVEPAIYFWDSPIWGFVINEGGTVLFMLITPLWVLRSRSFFGQAMGLLVPLAAYITAFVYALSSGSGFAHPEWFQFSLSKTISIALPFLVQFGILAIASVAYAWFASHSNTVREA